MARELRHRRCSVKVESMREEEVRKMLLSDAECPKEICLNDGRKYRIRHREQWMAGVILVIMQRREFVYISYRNIASINLIQGRGRGRRQHSA